FCVTRTDNCYSYTAQCSSNYTSLSLHDALPICESPYFISGGQQKKVQLLILAIISSPVILLDEILTGLDYASVALAWKLIETLKQLGCGILIIDHQFQPLTHYDYVLEIHNLQLQPLPKGESLNEINR